MALDATVASHALSLSFPPSFFMKKHLRLLLVPALVTLAACAPTDDMDGDVGNSSSTGMMMDSSESSDSMAMSIGMESSEMMMDASESKTSAAASNTAMEGEARVITVTSKNWEFAPAVIQVKKGEKVTLRFVDETGNHGIAVPGLDMNVYLPAGETVEVALNTDKTGTFEGFCNIPCGPGHRDMKFSVVVS